MSTRRHDSIPMISAPIEIPSRGRPLSPSQVPYRSALRATPYSPDLIFEMSPVEVETEAQSSSFRSLTISISRRWNRDQLFSFHRKLSGPLVHQSSSPQPESQQESKQATYSPRYSHTSSNDQHTNSGDAGAENFAPVMTVTPPIIRAVAVHRIAGFQPEKSVDPQSGTCRSSIVENASLPPLAPSDSSLTTTLPWLLPGTKDTDDDDHYHLSQSPAFDFKKYLLCRSEKNRYVHFEEKHNIGHHDLQAYYPRCF